MNKKPVQILVMVLIAIMFIATIVIAIVLKPTSDTTDTAFSAVITSELTQIAIASSSTL